MWKRASRHRVLPPTRLRPHPRRRRRRHHCPSRKPSAHTRATTPGTASGALPLTRTATTRRSSATITRSMPTACAETVDRVACSPHGTWPIAPTAPIAQIAARARQARRRSPRLRPRLPRLPHRPSRHPSRPATGSVRRSRPSRGMRKPRCRRRTSGATRRRGGLTTRSRPRTLKRARFTSHRSCRRSPRHRPAQSPHLTRPRYRRRPRRRPPRRRRRHRPRRRRRGPMRLASRASSRVKSARPTLARSLGDGYRLTSHRRVRDRWTSSWCSTTPRAHCRTRTTSAS